MLNPTIGRWNGVDALAESQLSFTPYHYTYNNPLNFTDPTGLLPRYNWDTEEYEDEDEEGNTTTVSWDDVQKAYGFGEYGDWKPFTKGNLRSYLIDNGLPSSTDQEIGDGFEDLTYSLLTSLGSIMGMDNYVDRSTLRRLPGGSSEVSNDGGEGSKPDFISDSRGTPATGNMEGQPVRKGSPRSYPNAAWWEVKAWKSGSSITVANLFGSETSQAMRHINNLSAQQRSGKIANPTLIYVTTGNVSVSWVVKFMAANNGVMPLHFSTEFTKTSGGGYSFRFVKE